MMLRKLLRHLGFVKPAAPYPGIELRICTVNTDGVRVPVVQGNSDMLHWVARYGGAGHGWAELLTVLPRTATTVRIEYRAVTLDGS